MLNKVLRLLGSPRRRAVLRYHLACRVLNRITRPIGFTILSNHYFHPVPEDAELRKQAGCERPLDSIAWRLDKQIAFVRTVLERHAEEINDPSVLASDGFSRAQSGLQSGDAELLYATIREVKPRRVVEIGAGGSTQLIAAALRRNFAETRVQAYFTSVEPFPQAFIRAFQAEHEGAPFMAFTLLDRPVQEVPLSVFDQLHDGDVLFVDSSHVFKTGSDVEHEFLRVYPSLNPGVLVHIHDIFFPFDYPVEWNTKLRRFWNEQYFLETFLQFNDKFAVLASLSMVATRQRPLVANAIRSFGPNALPGSFWMRVER